MKMMKPIVMTRIIPSMIVMVVLIGIVMCAWWILQPLAMVIVLSMESQISSGGNDALAIIKMGIEYWGVIVSFGIILTWGFLIAQRREWRGERFR